MSNKLIGEVDWEEMGRLAKESPEEFDRRAAELRERAIQLAPSQRQTALRQLQWRIDGELKRAGSPLGRFLRSIEMMSDSTIELKEVIDENQSIIGSIEIKGRENEND